MATALTQEDILRFVTAALKMEEADSDPVLARLLLRQCIAEAYRDTDAYDTSWSNTSGGALTLSGYICALPSDCLAVTRVEWDGSDNPLERRSQAWLDENYPGWRDATGNPTYYDVTGHQIVLDSTASDTTGKLVVRGFGCPDETDVVGLLPDDLQLALADYILAEWPVNPEKTASLFRFEKYTARWAGKRDLFFTAIRDRSKEPFSY